MGWEFYDFFLTHNPISLKNICYYYMSDFSEINACWDESHQDQILHDALHIFEVESINFATRFIHDSTVRAEYILTANRFSQDYLLRVQSRQISPYQAAKEVNHLRNELIKLARLRSSDIGRAAALKLKSSNKVLEELCEQYAKKVYNRNFNQLTTSQQNRVYKEIIKAAGRTRPSVNIKIKNLSRLGRGLLVLTLGIAVYNVITAEDRLRAAANEGAVIGGGFAGGAAGGALAGLACGPGAPVCVTLGVFIGGLIGGMGADVAFDQFF